MKNMELNLPSIRSFINSPLHFDALENQHPTKGQDWPMVDCHFEVSVYEYEGNLVFNLTNSNFIEPDPTYQEGELRQYFAVNFDLDRTSVIYLHKFLEAYLATQKK